MELPFLDYRFQCYPVFDDKIFDELGSIEFIWAALRHVTVWHWRTTYRSVPRPIGAHKTDVLTATRAVWITGLAFDAALTNSIARKENMIGW